jgi:predicted ABC-type ATPase
MPQLYVIAGPNGAGKTTFAREYLPRIVNCKTFVNADLIAAGLSPFDPDAAALRAGRLMVEEIRRLAAERDDFAFETTLAGWTTANRLRQLRWDGYRVHLFFLWLPSAELAVRRVAQRVRLGGHSVPESVIRRRYDKGLQRFFHGYWPLCNTWTMIDNSGVLPRTIASGDHQLVCADVPDLFAAAMEQGRNED